MKISCRDKKSLYFSKYIGKKEGWVILCIFRKLRFLINLNIILAFDHIVKVFTIKNGIKYYLSFYMALTNLTHIGGDDTLSLGKIVGLFSSTFYDPLGIEFCMV